MALLCMCHIPSQLPSIHVHVTSNCVRWCVWWRCAAGISEVVGVWWRCGVGIGGSGGAVLLGLATEVSCWACVVALSCVDWAVCAVGIGEERVSLGVLCGAELRWGCRERRIGRVSRLVMSCHAMSCHAVACHVMSCHVLSCRVVSCRVVAWPAVAWRGVSCRVVSCHVTSRHVMLCYVMLCSVLLCRITAGHLM